MIHKKLVAIILTIMTAVSVVVPTFATESPGAASNRPRRSSDDTANDTANSSASGTAAYTVQYPQVEQMVRNGNLQVQSNGLTIGNLSDEDETKSRFGKLADTVSSTQQILASIINSPVVSKDPAIITTMKDLKIVAQATNVSLASLLTMFRAQEDVSDDDYKLTELKVDEANDQLVKAAQNLFSVYHQLQYNIEQLTNTKVILEDAVKAAQAQSSAGLGTSMAVTDAQNAVASLDNSIADLQNQSKSVGYQMNQLLGHHYDDQITFGEMPEPDVGYVGKINLKNDIAAAIKTSYAVQIAQVQRNLADDGTDEDRDNIEIASNSIQDATEKVGAYVETQYNTTEKQQAVRDLDRKNLDATKVKLNQAKVQYATGAISKITLDTAENNYLKQQTVVEVDNATLFWDIETYKWIIKGLPAS